jgi:hypothetical protein
MALGGFLRVLEVKKSVVSVFTYLATYLDHHATPKASRRRA